METDFPVLPIEKSYDLESKYKTPTERYFTPVEITNFRHPGDDYIIYVHSNRVCVVTLAPTHELLTNESQIDRIEFQVNDKRNTLNTKVSGKRKHGAQRLNPNTVIFEAICPSKTYRLCTGISGKLLEVNPALDKEPNLLYTDFKQKGFMAIVLPGLDSPILNEIKKRIVE